MDQRLTFIFFSLSASPHQSRGVYETPGGEILRQAHLDIEGLTLDREVRKVRDMMSAKFAEYVRPGSVFACLFPSTDFLSSCLSHSPTSDLPWLLVEPRVPVCPQNY